MTHKNLLLLNIVWRHHWASSFSFIGWLLSTSSLSTHLNFFSQRLFLWMQKQDFFISSRRKMLKSIFFAAMSPPNGAQVRTISSAKFSLFSMKWSFTVLFVFVSLNLKNQFSIHFILLWFYENKKYFSKVLPLIIKIFIN